MHNSTLCYITRGDEVLMLHRTKKKDDPNEGKWIGIGGKFMENESPEECMLREVYEETGIKLTKWKYRAVITFVPDNCEGEYMHLFTAEADSFEFSDCTEGELRWIDKDKILSLNLWEGDRFFLEPLYKTEEFFSLKLIYEGDKLVKMVNYYNV